MKIQIEGNLYLESDSQQFIIKEYTGNLDKHGNEIYNTKGYYGSLEGAVKGLLKVRLLESTATTLKELVEDVRRLKADIESAIGV